MNSKPLRIANAALFVLLLFCALLLVLFRCSKRFDIIFYWYFVFGKPTCSAFKVVNVSRMSYRIAHYQMEAWYHLFIMTYDKFRKTHHYPKYRIRMNDDTVDDPEHSFYACSYCDHIWCCAAIYTSKQHGTMCAFVFNNTVLSLNLFTYTISVSKLHGVFPNKKILLNDMNFIDFFVGYNFGGVFFVEAPLFLLNTMRGSIYIQI